MRTAYMSKPRKRTWRQVTELEAAVVRASKEAVELLDRERRTLPDDEADDPQLVADLLSDVVVDVMHGADLTGDGQYDLVRGMILETIISDAVVADAAAILAERS